MSKEKIKSSSFKSLISKKRISNPTSNHEFKEYKRKGTAEMGYWDTDFDMGRVSISKEDAENGSPKSGDMIARNPLIHSDQWLVAQQYFNDNFEH